MWFFHTHLDCYYKFEVKSDTTNIACWIVSQIQYVWPTSLFWAEPVPYRLQNLTFSLGVRTYLWHPSSQHEPASRSMCDAWGRIYSLTSHICVTWIIVLQPSTSNSLRCGCQLAYFIACIIFSIEIMFYWNKINLIVLFVWFLPHRRLFCLL